jgi:hypothetical protein
VSLLAVSGRVVIPKEILDVARAGLFKRKEWRKVFAYVERGAMGAGGILTDNLNSPEVQVPLAHSTIERKRKAGLPTTALIGRRGRIQKALSSPTSVYRRRQVIMRRKGGVTFRVFFNPVKFQMDGKKDPFTQVLQRGRLKSFTLKSGRHTSKAETLARAKQRDLDEVTAANRMPGRPVMGYQAGNENKLTPALLKAVYQVLKEKGLAD